MAPAPFWEPRSTEEERHYAVWSELEACVKVQNNDKCPPLVDMPSLGDGVTMNQYLTRGRLPELAQLQLSDAMEPLTRAEAAGTSRRSVSKKYSHPRGRSRRSEANLLTLFFNVLAYGSAFPASVSCRFEVCPTTSSACLVTLAHCCKIP